MDVSALQAWIGRSEKAEDEVTLPSARRMAALLDVPSFERKRGDALPGGWYVLLFAPLNANQACRLMAIRPGAACCRRCRCRGACLPGAASNFAASS